MLPSPRPALSAVLLTGMNCANARTTSKPPSRRSFAPPLNGFARPFHHRRRADPAKTRQRPVRSLTLPRTRVPVSHRLRVRQGAAHIAAVMHDLNTPFAGHLGRAEGLIWRDATSVSAEM